VQRRWQQQQPDRRAAFERAHGVRILRLQCADKPRV
jgi:hypothetical protein